jgi:hypothetical protein
MRCGVFIKKIIKLRGLKSGFGSDPSALIIKINTFMGSQEELITSNH